MTVDLQTTLAQLQPRQRNYVMDLVAAAGIDVSSWATRSDPRRPGPVTRPRANPKYCYEWVFGNAQSGFVLCVWHSSLKIIDLPTGPAIGFEENLKRLAADLRTGANDARRPTTDRNRSRDQAKRATRFDEAVREAFRNRQSLRLIINEGERRLDAELGKSRSTVRQRILDDSDWYVHTYEDGSARVIRGIPPSEEVAIAAARASGRFVDQFSSPAPVAVQEVTGLVRNRSRAVRERVLARAKGACELCGELGFLTAGGAIYLETHHITPLSEGGADCEENVVALCPVDHRRAHHAHDRVEIASVLRGKASG